MLFPAKLTMVYLRYHYGIYYICEKQKIDGRWKEKYVASLGHVSEEEAKTELERWQFTPTKKYRTVVIDPPWPIEKSKRSVRPKQIEMDYPTISLEEIRDFGSRKILSLMDTRGCHIYLWTTQRHLRDAFALFDTWGIHYECQLTWIKNVGFTPFSWMYSTEFVLFGRIGYLSVIKKGLRTDFAGKVREHSRKPDEFYELVRQASPDPRIDIFSREKREGFDQYGNEIDKFNPIVQTSQIGREELSAALAGSPTSPMSRKRNLMKFEVGSPVE